MPRIFDDATPLDILLTGAHGTGLELPTGFAGPADYRNLRAGRAEPFPRDLVLDDSAIRALIEERKARGATHRERARKAGLKSKNQRRTNYCWINSPAYCFEFVRVNQNLPHVPLSPASGGGPIKNFRNVGGWGRQAVEWIADRGLVPTEFWPDNAISDDYYTDENRRRALAYRTTEWWVFDRRDLRAVASCVLGCDTPVSVGLNWWGHQVSYVEFEWRDGTFWPVFRNSYGDGWEDEGYAELHGSRALPDDAVAPRLAVAA